MIEADFFFNKNGDAYGFKIKNHGESLVCAAVSALAINAVNAVKAFVDLKTELVFNAEGGLIVLTVPALRSGAVSEAARVIINALKMGFDGINAEYPNSLVVRESSV